MAATLVVEDGTGLANSNSYTSMAESDAYHESMGRTTWVLGSPTDDARITAKIRATRWLDGHYSTRFPGQRVRERRQALQWPRELAYDQQGEEIERNEIPVELKQAQFEAEFREFTTPGYLAPDVVQTERVLREKVDVLEVQYADASRWDASIPIVSQIDDILANLLGRRSGTVVSFVKRA